MPTATAQAERAGVIATRAVSSASVEVFRIAFGLIGFASAARFLARGWVDSLYLAPAHHLTYPGFDWVRPLPAGWAHAHVGVVAVAGVAVALGWHTRVALVTFLFGLVWMELIDASLYLNHYWLVTLVGIALVLVPVGRRWAVDVRVGRVARSTQVPVWALWLLRGQVAVVYVAAGVAKIDVDWLVHAEPLGMWLGARTDRPVIGPWLGLPVTAHVAAWASAVFDCTIVGWLSWRRTRPWAYAAVVVFHLATAALFQIGLFPWMMVLLTPIFFDPTWPERLVPRTSDDRAVPMPETAPRSWSRPAGRPALTIRLGVAALVVVNVVAPARHHLYAGDVVENEVGYYGSLRVMLTEKTGVVTFVVTDTATGATWRVDPMTVFEPWQVSQLAARADLLVTAAHIVADRARRGGHASVEVRADGWVSINGRQRQRTVDPSVDLAALGRPIR